MELYDSMLAGASAERLQKARISVVPAQHSWVGIPAHLVNALYDKQIQTPLAIRLRVIPAAGFSRAPPSSKPRYVAWAGSISSTPGCIELPAGLSSVLHLPAGTEVSVELLPDLAAAAAVVVEPVGTADWEVVELNAEQLEDKLLNQAGVMCVSQPFPLWAGQARVMLQVTSIMHWPDEAAAAAAAGSRRSSQAGSSSSSGRKPMVLKDVARITDGTELHIAPKPRTVAGGAGVLGSGQLPLNPNQQQQGQQQQQREREPVWLRVVDLGHKHLLDTRDLHNESGSSSSSHSGGASNGCAAADGSRSLAAAAATAAAAKSWHTTAVFVSPSTARDVDLNFGDLIRLYGAANSNSRSSSSTSNNSSVFPLQSLVVLLLLDPSMPWGHVGVASPLQKGLGLAAHQYVKLQPLQQQQQQLQQLPGFVLHPLLPIQAGVTAVGAEGVEQVTAAGSSSTGIDIGDDREPLKIQQQQQLSNSSVPNQPAVTISEIEELITDDQPQQQQQQQQRGPANVLSRSDSFTGLEIVQDIVTSWVTKPVQLTKRISHTFTDQWQQQRSLGGSSSRGSSPGQQPRSVSSQQQQQQQHAAVAGETVAGLQDIFDNLEISSAAITAWLRLQAAAAAAAAAGGGGGNDSAVIPCCGPLLVHFLVEQQQQQQQQQQLDQLLGSDSSSSSSSVGEHLMLLLPHHAQGSSSSSSNSVLPASLLEGLENQQLDSRSPPLQQHQQQQQQRQNTRANKQLDIHIAKALLYDAAAAATRLSPAAAQHSTHISLISPPMHSTTPQPQQSLDSNHQHITIRPDNPQQQQQQWLDPADYPWLNPSLQICLDRLNPRLDLLTWQAWQSVDLPLPGGVLIVGASDSGRSWLIQLLGQAAAAAAAHNAHVLKVSCKGLAGQSHDAAVAVLAAAAAEVAGRCPGLLLLDDLDLITPAASGDPGQQEQDQTTATRIAWWLADLMHWSATQPRPIAFAATCTDAAAIPACLRAAGCLDRQVKTPAFGVQGRAALLISGLRSKGLGFSGDLSEIEGLAGKQLEGFDARDLQLVVDRAVHAALRRHTAAAAAVAGDGLGKHAALGFPPVAAAAAAVRSGSPSLLDRLAPDSSSSSIDSSTSLPTAAAAAASPQQLLVTAADLAEALSGFVPASFWRAGQQKGQQQQQQGLQGWDDVGGLSEAVAALKEVLLLPAKYGQQLAAAPLRLRTGLLLFGPPGCGKTHVVAAAVAATGARLLSVKGPELLNKYIGQSEAAVRDLFSRAAAAAPCVLFFDEFDAIAPPRGHDSTGVTDRVVNQLLTELDGVEGLTGVAVLAATSRPDLIDAALLRPGRLDRMVLCGMPEESERLQILTACARKLTLDSDVNFKVLAQQTVNFTSADVSALLSEAQLLAVHDRLDQTIDSKNSEDTENNNNNSVGAGGGAGGEAQNGPPLITMQHLQRALARARPSLPATELRRLAAVYGRFQQGRDPGINNRQVLNEGQQTVKHATLA